jgi:ribosomal protein L11 methyltransferase
MVETIREILIAQLAELGYDSFMETEEGLEGYIESSSFLPLTKENLPVLASPDFSIEISTENLEDKNWNQEWEKNYFKPIVIGKKCLVRSPFHEAPAEKPQYEVLIEPRMAFGTGYHETTRLMIEHLLELNITDKHVLDMGCGTGILGILASLRGAHRVTAIDIDRWATDNAKDNISLNNITNMEVMLGNAALLNNMAPCDLLLTNINRNTLMNDIQLYNKAIKHGSTIILSGFYNEDLKKIDTRARSFDWEHLLTKEHNNWIAVSYRKK